MASTPNLGLTFSVLSCTIWIVVFIPITIYQTLKYYKLSNHIIYQKRYAYIAIYESIIIISKIILDAIIYLYGSAEPQFKPQSILLAFSHTLSIILMYLWIWRFYHLHYDMQFTRAQLSNSWFNLIDNTFANSKTKKFEWYLKNRKTMGNAHWVRLFLIIPLTTVTIILAVTPRVCYTFIFSTVDRNHWLELGIYSHAVMLIPFCFLIILYWRTPAFEDSFFIVQELSRLFTVLFIYHTVAIVVDTWAISQPIEQQYTSRTYIIVIFIFGQIRITSLFICGLIPTYWVMKKCEPIIETGLILENVPISTVLEDGNYSCDKVQKVPLVKFSVTEVDAYESMHGSYGFSKLRSDIPLVQCLEHQRGVELFIEHLSTEMCVNFLLALVVFVQYQKYVYDYMVYNGLLDVEILIDEILWFEKIRFYDKIPKSTIVYENKNGVNIKDMNEKDFKYQIEFKGYKLYQRFIEVGGELQILLPFDTVEVLHEVMGNEDKFLFNDSVELRDLLFIFSSCCRDMLDALEESYQRFKQTTQYRKLQQLVFI